MRIVLTNPPIGWLITIISVSLAVLVTYLLPLGPANSDLLLMLAVAVSAWYGGLLAGLAAMGLAIVLGHLFLIRPLYSIRLDDGGDLVRLVLFIGVSLVVSFWADAERARRNLQEGLSRFQLLMENVTDYAIILLSIEGQLIDWNSGAGTILGLDPSDQGRSFETMLIPGQSSAAAWRHDLLSARQQGHVAHERWYRRKDGSRFWGFGTLTVLRDARGQAAGYVKILRDLTRRKREEEERQRLLAELEEANQAKERLMAMLAHDLRLPLQAILGWISLRHSGKLDDPERLTQALESIEKSGKMQLELIERLLEFAQIRSPRFELSPGKCELSVLLQEVIDSVRGAAEAKQVDIELRVDAEHSWIECDSRWLRQVFANLLSNAVKFTPEGGRVQVSCRRAGTQLEVQVRDTGAGIEPDFLPRVFEPFHHGGTQAGGFGLGLAICRHLVELHGGEIRAESAGSGRGATFTVTLPEKVRALDTAGGTLKDADRS